MKTYLLRYPGEWELTIMLGRLQIRVGNLQQAAWWHKGNYNFVELFNMGARIRAIRSAIQ
jgi:hypothetical protein